MAGLRLKERWKRMMALPTRRIFNRFTVSVGFRHKGLLRLQNDVSSCEYEDIHIMWNLLHKNEDLTQKKKKPCWNLIGSYLCQRF
ncbi:unnamed protein product [Cochlearia groenlandica]